MSVFKSLLVAAAIMGATPVAAQQVAVDKNFRIESFSWSGNGAYYIAWRPVLIDGKIAICGAYAVRGGRKYADLTRQSMQNKRIDTSSGAFMRNLAFFNRKGSAGYRTRLQGEMANCRVTQVAGTPEMLRTFRIGHTSQNYRF